MVHPNGLHAYITHRITPGHDGAFSPGGVSVIDTQTKTAGTVITVGNLPGGIAVHPTGNFLYVANQLSDTLSVINTGTNTVTSTIAVGSQPAEVAMHPSGSFVYVTNSGSNTVSKIDTATNTVVATISVQQTPIGIAIGGPSVKIVTIDIKPGSFPNNINLSAAGVIPVAIFSAPAFDAPAEIDPESLTLAGARVKVAGKSDKSLCHSEDVNHDGRLDLVCQFENDLNAQVGDTIAVLDGDTFSGTPIRGQDSISIVPDK